MGLFKPSKDMPKEPPADEVGSVPVAPCDVSRRYDIYCALIAETRVYGDVKVTGIRTFDRINQFS